MLKRTSMHWTGVAKPLFVGGNRVRLLQGGQMLFPDMVAAIGAAQREVWLASYIFHDDEAGQQVAQALAGAARKGVRVCVVVDGFGCLHSLPTLRAWLEPAGVELVVFRPLVRWWHWLQAHQLRRLHQKLCAVDDVCAFVGGINIVDDYNELRYGRSLLPRLDFAVALNGPLVVQVAQSIQATWTRAMLGHDWGQQVRQWARSAQPMAQMRRRWQQLGGASKAVQPGLASQPVQAAFVVRDNFYQRRTIERSCLAAIGQAHRRVDVVTPYFYPGRRLRRALLLAARRGVRVRLLLQGKLDYALAGLAARGLYAGLLAEGVEIYEYTPAFLHAKAVLVDEEWATVGSSNLDPLSLLLNLEANLVVRDGGFNTALSTAFEQALVSSRRIERQGSSGVFARMGHALVAVLARIYVRLAARGGGA